MSLGEMRVSAKETRISATRTLLSSVETYISVGETCLSAAKTHLSATKPRLSAAKTYLSGAETFILTAERRLLVAKTRISASEMHLSAARRHALSGDTYLYVRVACSPVTRRHALLATARSKRCVLGAIQSEAASLASLPASLAGVPESVPASTLLEPPPRQSRFGPPSGPDVVPSLMFTADAANVAASQKESLQPPGALVVEQ